MSPIIKENKMTNQNKVQEKVLRFLVDRINDGSRTILNSLQDSNQALYHDSEIWLQCTLHWTSECLEALMDHKSLYAFMLYQADAVELIDNRIKRKLNYEVPIYNQKITETPLAGSWIGSIKSENPVISPLSLHSRLKSKTKFDTLDYCIAKYLESNDPYFFTIYYLTLGDVLFKDMITLDRLDEKASAWFQNQISIAMNVESDLALSLNQKATMKDLHELITTKYGSVLKGLINYSSFEYQYAISYNYQRFPLQYFNDKYFNQETKKQNNTQKGH
jgi:hypothetical protein